VRQSSLLLISSLITRHTIILQIIKITLLETDVHRSPPTHSSSSPSSSSSASSFYEIYLVITHFESY
jgi:hypothetical protein